MVGDISPEHASPELLRLVGHLRSHVTRYVRERRAEGVPIEAVLPEVQRLMHEAEAAEDFPDELGVLMAQVVRWSIAVYDDAMYDDAVYDGEPEVADGPRRD